MKLSQKYIRARINILALASPRKAAIKAYRLFCTPRQRDTGQRSPLFEQAERLSFRYDDHTVRGYAWIPPGPPEKKVLIAHGFESSSRVFEGYIGALLEKGYAVVAFDAPAHGRSGGNRFTLPAYVQVLRIIDQHYGPFDAYIGHSIGGLALALLLENIPHPAAARLALIAPPVETTTALDTFARQMRLSPEVVKEMDDYLEETGGHRFAWYSLRRALPGVTAGILYVQDQEDRVTPFHEAVAVQQDGHPHVRFLFTRGSGHRKLLKDPDVLRQVIAFL